MPRNAQSEIKFHTDKVQVYHVQARQDVHKISNTDTTWKINSKMGRIKDLEGGGEDVNSLRIDYVIGIL
jgi:hypothetical protein